MPPELPLLFLDEPPPANLADLLALRRAALNGIPPPPALGEPGLTGAWERWRNGVVQVAARFAAHPCRGPGCAKCVECYVLAEVLESRKRHLVTARPATRVCCLRSRWPQGEA